MVRAARLFGLLAVIGLLAAGDARAADPIRVDVQLVLAIDSSGSISEDEFRLQMEGFTAAFRNPAVLEAIRCGPRGAVAITLMEWSSVDQQRQSIGWTMISDGESMATFAEQLSMAPRLIPGGSTSVSDALDHAARLFDGSGFVSERRVIDVSGDGSNNSGIPPDSVRDRLVAAGIVINGLAIVTDEPNLKDYYAGAVIGGAGSFVMVAENYQTFSGAILSKLIQEIAHLPTATRFAGATLWP